MYPGTPRVYHLIHLLRMRCNAFEDRDRSLRFESLTVPDGMKYYGSDWLVGFCFWHDVASSVRVLFVPAMPVSGFLPEARLMGVDKHEAAELD